VGLTGTETQLLTGSINLIYDDLSFEMQLSARVREAFELGEVPAGSVTRLGLPEERRTLERQFEGRRWQSVLFSEVSEFRFSLPLLSPGFFRHLLPAFVVRSLEYRGLEDDALEYVFLSLVPPQDKECWQFGWFVERMSGFDRQQRQVIREVVDFLSKDSGVVEDDRARAVEYWAAEM
jgi:hypothetical protein